MARPARPWFRFYVEAMRDPKMRRLTPAQRWLWVAILAAARESCIPGVLMVAETEPMALWELADYAAVKEREIAPALDKMCSLGMVRFDDERQAWAVSNFADRQYESDSSAERVAKHRELKRDCNGGITLLVTPPETETETDTERPPRTRGKTACPDGFQITDEMRDWVLERYPTLDYDRHTEGFVAWAKANDRRYSDWVQAWRNWMHRKADDATKGAFR
jgi:hypothetical protein